MKMKHEIELVIPTSGLRQFILNLANQHNVVYVKTYGDAWADVVTRLSGDDVETDDIECLIIELKREGVISGKDMVALLGTYLGELKNET
jgi:hypothetical protein